MHRKIHNRLNGFGENHGKKLLQLDVTSASLLIGFGIGSLTVATKRLGLGRTSEMRLGSLVESRTQFARGWLRVVTKVAMISLVNCCIKTFCVLEKQW